jgi:hypothetical protein
MMRATLTFFSMLALGTMTAAVILALMPWFTGRVASGGTSGGGLHFESVMLGLVLGLMLGIMSRYNWADVPRRIITWALIRERQFFYYALIVGCIGVMLFY